MAYRICVVCSGNICRSPIGAVVLRAKLAEAGLGDEVQVTSGGMGDWHVGDAADHRARAALRRAGYDGEEHRAAHFQRDWFASHDLILAADQGHVRALRTLAPDDAARAKIRLIREFDAGALSDELDMPDPYYGSAEDFDWCVHAVEAATPGLLEHVTRAGSQA